MKVIFELVATKEFVAVSFDMCLTSVDVQKREHFIGWVKTNSSNIRQHPYLKSAKAISVVP
jgi:hypothetical protein